MLVCNINNSDDILWNYFLSALQDTSCLHHVERGLTTGRESNTSFSPETSLPREKSNPFLSLHPKLELAQSNGFSLENSFGSI